MDKVLSARLDATVVDELDRMSRRLGVSKKTLLEEAIRMRARRTAASSGDVWTDTCGLWRRREEPAATVRRVRRAFEQAMHRTHRPTAKRTRRSARPR
jgi:hypothetical protein